MQTAIAQSSVLVPLWDRARATFARASGALGGAARIAAISALTRAMRKEIVGWVGRLEHIVRKLLLAEAAELHRLERAAAARGPRLEIIGLSTLGLACHGAPVGATARAHANRKTNRAIDLAHPETWSAQFSLGIPRDPRACPESRAPHIRALWGPPPPSPPPPPQPQPRRAPKSEDAPFRLARRFEALRRVLEKPGPHAARLARIMRRLTRGFPEAPMRFATAGPSSHAVDPADPRLSIECYIPALEAAPVFDSS